MPRWARLSRSPLQTRCSSSKEKEALFVKYSDLEAQMAKVHAGKTAMGDKCSKLMEEMAALERRKDSEINRIAHQLEVVNGQKNRALEEEASVSLKTAQARKLKTYLATEAAVVPARLPSPRLPSPRMASSEGVEALGSDAEAKPILSSSSHSTAIRPRHRGAASPDDFPSHNDHLVVTFHLSTFQEAAPLSALGLREKADDVRRRVSTALSRGGELGDAFRGARFSVEVGLNTI